MWHRKKEKRILPSTLEGQFQRVLLHGAIPTGNPLTLPPLELQSILLVIYLPYSLHQCLCIVYTHAVSHKLSSVYIEWTIKEHSLNAGTFIDARDRDAWNGSPPSKSLMFGHSSYLEYKTHSLSYFCYLISVSFLLTKLPWSEIFSLLISIIYISKLGL